MLTSFNERGKEHFLVWFGYDSGIWANLPTWSGPLIDNWSNMSRLDPWIQAKSRRGGAFNRDWFCRRQGKKQWKTIIWSDVFISCSLWYCYYPWVILQPLLLQLYSGMNRTAFLTTIFHFQSDHKSTRGKEWRVPGHTLGHNFGRWESPSSLRKPFSWHVK